MSTQTQDCHSQFITDDTLVSKAREGDHTAFNTLFDRYRDSYIRVATRVLGSEADANDAVQEAFINIFTKIDSYNRTGTYKGWSYRIVVNCARMQIRKRVRRREVHDEKIQEFDFDIRDQPDHALEQVQLRHEITGAMEQLKPKYREIIELREIEGLTMDEMSRQLDISTGGVKARLHRARNYLQTNLNQRLTV